MTRRITRIDRLTLQPAVAPAATTPAGVVKRRHDRDQERRDDGTPLPSRTDSDGKPRRRFIRPDRLILDPGA